VFGNWWTWRKNKTDPKKSYLANGKFSVQEVNSILGRYAVVNENEKDKNWFTIAHFKTAEDANRLAEAYNRIAERDA